jgi:two-component system, cell cycle response regulator
MIRIAEERASRVARSLSALKKPLQLRVRELETRVAELQRENLDLAMKNRVLAEVSARDSLTGLYNRWYVMEKIESEMNRSLRHGSPVALLMLDIDHFKRINDSFGHSAGDSVLRSFGQVLRESCRVYDVPGRYGGEEFCIVLPETRVGNTTAVAERIRQRLASSLFDVGTDQVAITASIGIAGLDSPEEEGLVTSSALIERADRALYSAKHRGRNRIEIWSTAETTH